MDIQYKQIICLNGHQLTDGANWNKPVTGYCKKCGKKLIDSCPISDTPKTKLAAYKWKKFGKPILDVAKDILVGIATEATVRTIYPN